MMFFLEYLLLPIIVIALGAVAIILKMKNDSLSSKRLIVFVLLYSLVIALPGLMGFAGNNFTPWFYLATQGIHMVLGISFVQFYIRHIEGDIKEYKILFQLVTMFLCMLLGCFLYAMLFNVCSPVKSGYVAATTIVVFPLPLLFYWTYILLINIPFEIYEVWQYNQTAVKIDFDGMDYTKLMVLKLEFGRRQNDNDRLSVQAKAPSEVPFGDWFRKFIDDYNEKFPQNTIEYKNDNQESFSWIFYLKRSFFHKRQYIDPSKSIKENKIPEHAAIISKRVIAHDEEKVVKKRTIKSEL